MAKLNLSNVYVESSAFHPKGFVKFFTPTDDGGFPEGFADYFSERGKNVWCYVDLVIGDDVCKDALLAIFEK